MGEKKQKLATGRVKLLNEAIERVLNHRDVSDSLLTEVLGGIGSAKYERYKQAFTDNELCFMSIVLDRTVVPWSPCDPKMLYRYRHYKPRLYKDKVKLALVAMEGMLTNLAKGLPSVETLLTRDLDTLGLEGTFSVDVLGNVSLWIESYAGYTSHCGQTGFSEKLPFNIQTTLEQVYHASQFSKLLNHLV